MQTEMALRMTTAGLEVERVDVPAAELAADPDFPGRRGAARGAPRRGRPAGRRARRDGGRSSPATSTSSAAATSSSGRRRRSSPRIADGLLYGRGACDMKAGVVAGLAALRALVEAEVELGGEAILLTVPGEEDGGAGMLAAIRAGLRRRRRGHHRADRAPDRDRPGRGDHLHAHDPGAKRARGVPARGRLGDREAVADHVRARGERARAERRPSRCVRCASWASPTPRRSARVAAGEWSSTVPDRLVAEGRYGVRVGQTRRRGRGRAAVGHRRGVCRPTSGCATIRPTSRSPAGASPRPRSPNDHPLPWGLAETARDVLGRLPDFLGMPYGADARLLIDHGDDADRPLRPRRPEPGPRPGRARRARGRRALRAGARRVGHARAGLKQMYRVPVFHGRSCDSPRARW